MSMSAVEHSEEGPPLPDWQDDSEEILTAAMTQPTVEYVDIDEKKLPPAKIKTSATTLVAICLQHITQFVLDWQLSNDNLQVIPAFLLENVVQTLKAQSLLSESVLLRVLHPDMRVIDLHEATPTKYGRDMEDNAVSDKAANAAMALSSWGLNVVATRCTNLTELDLGGFQSHILADTLQSLANLRLSVLGLSGVNVSTAEVTCFFSPHLQRLDLSWSTAIQTFHDIYAKFRVCTSLTHLDISGAHGHIDAILLTLLAVCPSLQHLEMNAFSTTTQFQLILEDEAFTTKDVRGVPLNLIGLRPHLQHFSAVGSASLSNLALIYLLQHCPNMTSIVLQGVSRVDDVVLQYVGLHCPGIQELTLADTRVTDVGVLSLVQTCHRLTHIDLSWCEDVTSASLDRLLSSQRSLYTVTLRCLEGVTDETVRCLSRFPSLRELDVSRCSNVHGETVVEIVSSCPLLTHLKLSWISEVSDEHVQLILRSCPHLCVLDLEGCKQVTDQTLMHLQAWQQEGHGLRFEYLNLIYVDRISDRAIEQLLRYFPILLVSDYYGHSHVAR